MMPMERRPEQTDAMQRCLRFLALGRRVRVGEDAVAGLARRVLLDAPVHLGEDPSDFGTTEDRVLHQIVKEIGNN